MSMGLNWFLGFIEGEGSFSISFRVRHDQVTARPYFQVNQAEREVLGKIQAFLCSNSIISSVNRQGNNWILQVQRHSDVYKLVKLLEAIEWYSKKGDSFQLWKKGLKIMTKGCSKTNLKKIAGIAEKINASSGKKGNPRKFTPEFIEKECFSNNRKVMLIHSRGY